MRKRLSLCGLRSINNVVDITNFVLLEMGQPMHAFDLSTLSGKEIVVRRAKEGEEITTLDEKTFKLSHENLVICDGGKPAALAGIMGGLNSEIKENTAELLFEAAKFARDSVRKTARALGQHSDSSAAFEKGVNEYTTALAMDRALHLIEELGCGTVTDVHCDVKTEYSHDGAKKMNVSISKINELLGITVPTQTMCDILKRLDFGVDANGDTLTLDVPAYREDIDGYPDIAEEIIRMYGYEHIHGTFMPTAAVTNGGFNDEQKAENDLKRALVEQAMYEISTYSFYSEKDLDLLKIPADAPERRFIKIKNPIGEDLSVMRTTLAPSMLHTIVRNLRRGNMEGRLFEIAKVYLPRQLPLADFPDEKKRLCIGLFGTCDFFDLKGVTEAIADSLRTTFEYVPSSRSFLHPGVCADIVCGGKVIGYAGRLDPAISNELALERKVFVAELDYDALMSCAHPFKYKPLPKFAEVTRDLALVADMDVTCGQIEKAISGACKYVTDVKLFDIYVGAQVGANKKSMAFTVTFTPGDEPITPEKCDSYIKKILSNLSHNLNVTLSFYFKWARRGSTAVRPRRCLLRHKHTAAEHAALQVNFGDLAVYYAFADEYFCGGEHPFGAGGKNYCYIGDDIDIHRMNGLVDPRLRKARYKIALHRYDGHHLHAHASAIARERLDARKSTQRYHSAVGTQPFEGGLSEICRISRNCVYFGAVGSDGGDVAR